MSDFVHGALPVLDLTNRPIWARRLIPDHPPARTRMDGSRSILPATSPEAAGQRPTILCLRSAPSGPSPYEPGGGQMPPYDPLSSIRAPGPDAASLYEPGDSACPSTRRRPTNTDAGNRFTAQQATTCTRGDLISPSPVQRGSGACWLALSSRPSRAQLRRPQSQPLRRPPSPNRPCLPGSTAPTPVQTTGSGAAARRSISRGSWAGCSAAGALRRRPRLHPRQRPFLGRVLAGE